MSCQGLDYKERESRRRGKEGNNLAGYFRFFRIAEMAFYGNEKGKKQSLASKTGNSYKEGKKEVCSFFAGAVPNHKSPWEGKKTRFKGVFAANRGGQKGEGNERQTMEETYAPYTITIDGPTRGKKGKNRTQMPKIMLRGCRPVRHKPKIGLEEGPPSL